jgi:hypothetical protein
VVNAGISNRLIDYGRGPSAMPCLDRDVLSPPRVDHVARLEGSQRHPQQRAAPTPFEGSALHGQTSEVTRQAMNAFIRAQGTPLA